MPAASMSESSGSVPITACWWQWVCTSASTSSRGGVQSGAFSASSSARVRVWSESRRMSSSPTRSSGPSARNTAVQDGSRPTTGTPARRSSRSTPRVRRSTFFATSSWPVETQVRPQQTGSVGTCTSNPASSSTRTAQRATSGLKALVKVSGHSSTGPRVAGTFGRLRGGSVPPGPEEGVRVEAGDVPLRSDPPGSLEQGRNRGARGEGVDDPRRQAGESRPYREPPHRVMGPRTHPVLVVVGEELRLVGRHVDAHGAVGLAPLAGQAEVQRIPHGGGPPPVGDRRTSHISNSRRARPRVECSSSRVTMYDGHMTWFSLTEFRQFPIPTHRRAAREKLPSSSG